jgi:hypothetical protein
LLTTQKKGIDVRWPLLTLSLVVSLAAFASGQTKFVKKNPVKIGYSVADMQQPYCQAYWKGTARH